MVVAWLLTIRLADVMAALRRFVDRIIMGLHLPLLDHGHA
jgi:hypothetical protein